MAVVNKYKIYCVTEDKFVEGYGLEMPTKCYNNTVHDVNPNSPTLVEEIKNDIITICQEKIKTNGIYCCECIYSDQLLPNATTDINKSWKFPISILDLHIKATNENVGDTIYCCRDPFHLIGSINSEAKIGTSTISASNNVVKSDYIKLGKTLSLDDGNGHNEMVGIITDVDTNLNTISVSEKILATFPADTTNIHISNCLIKNMVIVRQTSNFSICSKPNIGLYVPTGMVFRTRYINSSPTITKKISIVIEYIY